MKKIISLLSGIVLLFPTSGCLKTELDPVTVVTRYYSAVEEGNATHAYYYLCDRSFDLEGIDGSRMRFKARPGLSEYVAMMGTGPKISISSIEEQTHLSIPDRLIVFKITASVKEQDRNVVNSNAQFQAFLGLNSEKKWTVMLPDYDQ